MGARTGIFSGQNRWDMIRFAYIEGTVVILMLFLFLMLHPLVHVIFWPIYITIGIVLNISLPIYLKDKHQKVANNKDFSDCTIRWGLFDKGEFLLGFIDLKRITPDYSDVRVKEFQESRDFYLMLQKWLTRVLVEDFHSKRMGNVEMKRYFEQKKKGTVEENLLEQGKAVQVELNEITERRGEDEKVAKEKANEYDLQDLPYSYLNLEDIGIDRERLKTMEIYIGLLYEEECREGHTTPFDRVVIVMDGTKETLLKTSSMEAVDKDEYDIDIHGVKCYYICVDWELDHIPVLYLHWSENMTDKIMDESLKAQSIKYLNLKILEELLFHKAADSTQASLKIRRLEVEKEIFENELSDTIQNFYADGAWGFGNRSGNQKQLIEATLKAKQWKTYTALIFIVASFLLIFVVFFNFAGAGGNVPVPAP